MRGISGVRGIILYGILILLVAAIMPSFVTLNNAAAGQLDPANPAFLAVTLVPIAFFAAYIFKGWTHEDY